LYFSRRLTAAKSAGSREILDILEEDDCQGRSDTGYNIRLTQSQHIELAMIAASVPA
jgi:hypothetical protein